MTQTRAVSMPSSSTLRRSTSSCAALAARPRRLAPRASRAAPHLCKRVAGLLQLRKRHHQELSLGHPLERWHGEVSDHNKAQQRLRVLASQHLNLVADARRRIIDAMEQRQTEIRLARLREQLEEEAEEQRLADLAASAGWLGMAEADAESQRLRPRGRRAAEQVARSSTLSTPTAVATSTAKSSCSSRSRSRDSSRLCRARRLHQGD